MNPNNPHKADRLKLRPLCLALASLLPVAAHADDADETRSWTLPELIVAPAADSITAPITGTATRTQTPVEKVPQSIQTLTRTLIEDQQLQDVSTALKNVSGVSPSTMLETVLQVPLVRGFGVNYYFDGLPTYGLPSTVADPASLINVQQIEVAKGPSSTLYGGGSGAPLSGLLNIVSRLPDSEFGGSAAIRVGSFDTFGGEFDVSPPGEHGAWLLTGMAEQADSYIDVIDSRRHSFYPTFAYDFSPDTKLVVRAQYNKLEQREYAGLPAELTVVNGLLIDRDRFSGAEDAPRTTSENQMVTADLTHDLEDSQWRVAVRHYDGKVREYATFPLLPFGGTVYAFGSGYLPADTSQTFATLSWTRDFGTDQLSHRLLLGVDADRTDYEGGLGINFEWGLIDYNDPTTNLPFGATPVATDLQQDDLNTLAVFAQDQIQIGERLNVLAGIRFSQLDVQSQYTSSGIPFVNTDETYNEWTPRVGATFAVSDSVSLFAGHARGFQGVVAAFGVTDPEPESSTSNEFGIKLTQPIDGLTGTIAWFDITRENVITADPDNVGFSIQTGEQRARGLEADLVYEPNQAWSVLFNYAHTNAEVTEDNRLPVGDRLRRVPKQSARLAAHYRFQSEALAGFELGAGVTGQTERELTLPNTVTAPGIALVDAQLAYDFGAASVSLSIQNLFDRESFEPYQYLGGAYVVPTMPRSVFVTVRTAF